MRFNQVPLASNTPTRAVPWLGLGSWFISQSSFIVPALLSTNSAGRTPLNTHYSHASSELEISHDPVMHESYEPLDHDW